MLLVFGLCEFLVPVLDKQTIVIIGCGTGPNNELHRIHPVPFKVCAKASTDGSEDGDTRCLKTRRVAASATETTATETAQLQDEDSGDDPFVCDIEAGPEEDDEVTENKYGI